MKKIREQFFNLKLNYKFTAVIIIAVTIPIAILAGVLFYNMEKNVIHDSTNYMQNTMERNRDQITTNISSINMSTQFFLSDAQLQDVLNGTITGKPMTTKELLDFQQTDIASLERLVNNNPLLYQVRVYATNDQVQEMMPILYKHSRMERLEWAEQANEEGWHYNYVDTTFSTFTMNQNRKILSLVTPIYDYDNGQIGTIEAAMTMETMFPELYEDIENEWSCFATDDGQLYFGANEQTDSTEFVAQVLVQMKDQVNSQTYYSVINHEHMVIAYVPISELGGTLISVRNISDDISYVYQMRSVFILAMIGVLIGLSFVINHIVKRLLRKFYEILKSIREIQKGDLDVRITDCGMDEMGELGTQINKMLDRIQTLMNDNLNRELLVKNSEIKALQNQINAHFIYNVLESIKMMAEIDEEYAISDAITSLGKLLRYSMKWVSGNVLVSEELEYIRNYLALINLRFDYEIYLSLNIPEEIRQQEIPKMSLQPIVENAIYHGIEQMAEDTNIYIKGIYDGDDCIIEITDAGKGMTEVELEELRGKIAGEIEASGGSSGNGIGLKNVQDRVTIAFGAGYGIQVASKLGCYTKVMVRIPLHHKSNGGIGNEDSSNR